MAWFTATDWWADRRSATGNDTVSVGLADGEAYQKANRSRGLHFVRRTDAHEIVADALGLSGRTTPNAMKQALVNWARAVVRSGGEIFNTTHWRSTLQVLSSQSITQSTRKLFANT